MAWDYEGKLDRAFAAGPVHSHYVVLGGRFSRVSMLKSSVSHPWSHCIAAVYSISSRKVNAKALVKPCLRFGQAEETFELVTVGRSDFLEVLIKNVVEKVVMMPVQHESPPFDV